MDIYENNSHRFREEQAVEEKKKVEKVVQGTVRTKKKNGFQKFAGFLVSDDVSNIKSYVVKDIVIPSVKKAISETIDMILYGSSRGRSSGGPAKVSYRSYYDDPRPRDPIEPRSTFNYDDIILDNRGEAENVLDQMCDLIDTYKVVSVADLYDLVGITGDYTNNRYGWTNLRNAEVIRVRDGYMLKLPRPLPIK